MILALLVACVVLLTLNLLALVAVLVALARVLNREAQKRGMLDAVDLLYKRKQRRYA